MNTNEVKKHYGRGCPRPSSDKELTIKLLAEGCSFRSVGRIVGVPHQTVSRWLASHVDSLPKSEVGDLSDGVEIDELCTFVKKK